jgi:uncharacterized protein (TIGR00369 family)
MTTTAAKTKSEHHRRLERMYAKAPINEYYAPKITIGEGTAEIVIEVKPDFFHAGNAVHGSVYFKALDDAAFFAANSVVDEYFVLTATFYVQLMRPVSAGKMRAVGKLVQGGSTLLFADAVLYDDSGREIARGQGSFARSRVKLSPEMGYE